MKRTPLLKTISDDNARHPFHRSGGMGFAPAPSDFGGAQFVPHYRGDQENADAAIEQQPAAADFEGEGHHAAPRKIKSW